jgi:hypothetical protein
MKTFVNARSISLLLVLVLGSLYASSFFLPVLKVGDRTLALTPKRLE